MKKTIFSAAIVFCFVAFSSLDTKAQSKIDSKQKENTTTVAPVKTNVGKTLPKATKNTAVNKEGIKAVEPKNKTNTTAVKAEKINLPEDKKNMVKNKALKNKDVPKKD